MASNVLKILLSSLQLCMRVHVHATVDAWGLEDSSVDLILSSLLYMRSSD